MNAQINVNTYVMQQDQRYINEKKCQGHYRENKLFKRQEQKVLNI